MWSWGEEMMNDIREGTIGKVGHENGAKNVEVHDGVQLALVDSEICVNKESGERVLKEVQNVMMKENVRGKENVALIINKGVECVVDKAFWRQIWKLPILPKYRAFMWRACEGILPTVCSLQSRGVMLND
ncbi:Polynucleotidyl transferase, Ribonuclease H fold [Senna tora]|uniref:Polynucleotidyl transferase, Ribonuclease H fold n=1 Tax=Senna tora TaxID=362788 RepID=A0A834THQ1_9FABA|nr:Polynucleotidyl transferase, Ribonuclease H fold [Senna tora]